MANEKHLCNSGPMKIALCVTGSISAYKALDLTRLYIKAGHQVRVILTRGALEFVVAKTFSYLGAEKVYGPEDDFTTQDIESGEGPVLHINLIKWADIMVVAPLSANTLSDFAHAKASNLMTSMFLAWNSEKPLFVFPAMNTLMLNHPFTQENLNKLKSLPYLFVGTTSSGTLACGDKGEGKLQEIETIFALTESYTLKQSDKKLLLTTGATLAPLDSVRYLTNASTGKTAIPFITQSLRKGIKTIVIAGRYATNELERFNEHPLFNLSRITTTDEMHDKVHQYFKEADYYISTAAIGDFYFPQTTTEENKIKKSTLGDGLPIAKSKDILKSVLEVKAAHQKVVGFAAETLLSDEVLKEKFGRKPVDFLVGTQVSSGLIKNNQQQGFGADEAIYRFVDATGKISTPMHLTKEAMATEVLERIIQ